MLGGTVQGQQSRSMTEYRNKERGYRISYPADLFVPVPGPGKAAPGSEMHLFKSRDGHARLFWSSSEEFISIQTVYAVNTSSMEVKSKLLGENRYTASGKFRGADSTSVYQKAITGSHSYICSQLMYEDSERGQYEPIAQAISDSFEYLQGSPQAATVKAIAFSFDPYEQIRLGMTMQEVTSILQGRAVGTNVDEGVDDGPPRPGTNPLMCLDHGDIQGERECISQLYKNPFAEMMHLMFYRDRLFYLRSGCRGCAGLIDRLSKTAGRGPGPQCGPTPSNGDPRRSWNIGATAVCVTGREGDYLQVEELDWHIAPPGTLPQ
jgi:hypothetical protein